MAARRNKEETIQKLIDAVGDILKEKGHIGLGVNKIAARAGVHKKLIYYYFQSVNNLVKAYIRKKDYWLPLFDSFQWPESLERDRIEQLFIDFLVEQLRFFDKETEMQKLILWQISEANPVMRGISDLREIEGARFLKLTDPYFEDSDVDFRSVCALLVGGIYYIVLHRYHNQSTICGIDISQENDYLQLIISIRQILEWTWKAAAESKSDPTEIKSTTNMKYELEELEYRVKSFINGETQADKDWSDWINRVEKLPKNLMENALGLDNSKLPMFVRWHQEGLVDLIDQLYTSNANGSTTTKAVEMIGQLETLLSFLTRSFKNETNSDVPITHKLWNRMLEELPVKVDGIGVLLDQFIVDASLKEITLISLTNWLDKRTNEPPAFQQYFYTEMYAVELESWLTLGFKVNQENLLCKFVELNFNHLRAFHCWVKHIEHETQVAGPKKEILLKRLKRNIQHISVMQQAAYNTQANSLKDQLVRWIDEEICLINDEQILNTTNIKIKINLPVSAIAYFNKLLYKYRFYNEENQTLIMRHTVDNFSSIDTEEISFNSYSSKYRMKTPPDNAVRALRKILKPIMDEVDSVLN